MNFIKRVGSFAFNSWRDFSDYNDQCPLNEPSEVKAHEFDPVEQARTASVDDDDFVRRKSVQGFFRKRFSKKKLVVLDDPRSPSTQFQRTPLQLNNTFDSLGEVIVSPFDVQNMLDTVETAVDVTPKKSSAQMASNVIEVTAQVYDKEGDKEELTNEIWKEFNYNERVLTDSMIVEFSSFEIQNNNATTTIDNVVGTEEVEKDINIISKDDKVNQTVEVNGQEKFNENENISVTDDTKIDGTEEEKQDIGSCKVIGIVAKKEETIHEISKTLDSFIVSSTPKKSAAVKDVESIIKKAPRTPLMAICNSPSVQTSSTKNQQNATKKSELSKKKKLNSAKLNRQLPRAPSTPMTPLFKGKQNAAKCIAEFDKENF